MAFFVRKERCKYCAGELVDGKCTNPNCGGRSLARMVNMCAKLNMNGFGEATINQLDVLHLKDLMEIFNSNEPGYILSQKGFGPGEISNMTEEIDKIMMNPLMDSTLLGCLGFDNISTKTWALILTHNTIEDIDNLIMLHDPKVFTLKMSDIKGIGPSTIETILNEWEYFRDDILYMLKNAHIIHYQPISGKKVRATGFRDKDLFEYLRVLGFDADDNGSLTKDTDILLVPYDGFTSTKTQKAQQYNTMIVPVNEFRDNISKYM